MSLDILSRDILLKAQIEKDQFDLELKEEFSDAELACSSKVDIFKSKLAEKYDSDLKIQKEKILGSFKKDAKKEVLLSKSILLNKVYSQVLENFENLKKDQKEEFLKKLILRASDIIKFDTIICSKKDYKFVKTCVSKDVKIIIDELLLGLKFIGNEGKEILDLTYLSLLKEVYDTVEDKVQNVLFNI